MGSVCLFSLTWQWRRPCRSAAHAKTRTQTWSFSKTPWENPIQKLRSSCFNFFYLFIHKWLLMEYIKLREDNRQRHCNNWISPEEHWRSFCLWELETTLYTYGVWVNDKVQKDLNNITFCAWPHPTLHDWNAFRFCWCYCEFINWPLSQFNNAF